MQIDRFETYRPLLFALAYRMTGSANDAEDIVQDAYIHCATTPTSEIISLEPYVLGIVVRLCGDYLVKALPQREDYLGPWLPEPVLTPDADLGPLQTEAQRRSISLAFLTSMDVLSPLERAAFLLHDVFDYGDDALAEAVDRSPATCRELAARARARLAGPPRVAAPVEAQRSSMEHFLMAWHQGDQRDLQDLLAPSVMSWSDAGGKVPAATRPVSGQDAVTRLLIGMARKAPRGLSVSFEEINAGPALVSWIGDDVDNVLAFDLAGTRIQALRLLLNPDKLVYLRHQMRLRAEPPPRFPL